jgi:hypothetical protein
MKPDEARTGVPAFSICGQITVGQVEVRMDPFSLIQLQLGDVLGNLGGRNRLVDAAGVLRCALQLDSASEGHP